MIVLLYLLASFGLVYGFQNRISFLHEWALGECWWHRKLTKLLECAYCAGFWAGWATWAASWGIQGVPVIEQGMALGTGWPLWVGRPLGGLAWAFASAGTCCLLNGVLDKLERGNTWGP